MIDNFLRNALLQSGLFASKLAPDSEVRSWMRQLRPKQTNKKLIRIGGNSDGGYLVPDDLDEIEFCFSPGVSDIANFEQDLANRGIRSFLADYSVEKAPIESEMISFLKKFLGTKNDEQTITLQTWIDQLPPRNKTSDLILQMDIEGSEYDVILETPIEVWKRFRIVLIEFHGLQTAFNPYFLKTLSYCFQKLSDVFEIVHIHPNNVAPPMQRNGIVIPSVMELSLLRKDRISQVTWNTQFPHPLDEPNVPGRPDPALPKCWYT
jgi:hypothetical protein